MTMFRTAFSLIAGLGLAGLLSLGGCASNSNNYDPWAHLPLDLPTDGAGQPSMVARDSVGTMIYRDKPGGIAHKPGPATERELRLSSLLDEETLD